MMDAMTNLLLELGMPNEHIFTEAFGAAQQKANVASSTSLPTSVTTKAINVNFMQSNVSGKAGPHQTILDVADNENVDIDNSCRVGACGSCKVKLISGDVTMEVDDGLDETDQANGYVLACQAVPKNAVEVDA